jgi:hypothetical protein
MSETKKNASNSAWDAIENEKKRDRFIESQHRGVEHHGCAGNAADHPRSRSSRGRPAAMSVRCRG